MTKIDSDLSIAQYTKSSSVEEFRCYPSFTSFLSIYGNSGLHGSPGVKNKLLIDPGVKIIRAYFRA